MVNVYKDSECVQIHSIDLKDWLLAGWVTSQTMPEVKIEPEVKEEPKIVRGKARGK
jgi:hypothetical protein